MKSYLSQITREQIYVIAGFLLFSILVFFFISKPLISGIYQDSIDIRTMEQQIENAKQWKTITGRLREENETLAGVITNNQKTYLYGKSSFDIIKYVQENAVKSKVKVVLIEPVISSKKTENPQVQFKVTGSFHQIGKLVHTIETGPYLVFIKSLTIEKAKKTKNTLIAKVVLEIHQ